jgi:hypothetical protein
MNKKYKNNSFYSSILCKLFFNIKLLSYNRYYTKDKINKCEKHLFFFENYLVL